MKMSEYDKMKAYAARRAAEIMDNAKFMQDMKIQINFDGCRNTPPTIKYYVQEAVVPEDMAREQGK